MTDESPGLSLDLPEEAPASSPYRVLARKYRPQSFGELIGQDAVVKTLANAIERGGTDVGAWPATGSRVSPDARIYARSASDDKAPIVALMAMLDAWRAAGLTPPNQLKFLFEGDEEAGSAFLADIARLKVRRTAELLRIVKALRAHGDLTRRLDLVLSVPGIGERTAIALVVRMPELGRVSREQAAALAGLAPFDDDSGTHKGRRHIAGGRERLRRSLYAAALPAAFRWNKALVALYTRLMARGKAHNAALVACARKLLIYANTVVHRGSPWTETTATA